MQLDGQFGEDDNDAGDDGMMASWPEGRKTEHDPRMLGHWSMILLVQSVGVSRSGQLYIRAVYNICRMKEWHSGRMTIALTAINADRDICSNDRRSYIC